MSTATLQASVTVNTVGAEDVKKLAGSLVALDKSLGRIQSNAKVYTTYMGNLARSMTTASKQADNFATAIAKADANLDRFRQNMKGATGRTKNIGAGINEASFERAIKMTKELNGQLAQLANRMKLVPRSKTINVNAKMTETQTKPRGKSSNLSQAKTTNFSDVGFAEGIGEVNFQKIREMQNSVQEFKNDVNKNLMPIQKKIESFGAKSQLSFEKAFKTPQEFYALQKNIADANLAGRNVRNYMNDTVKAQQQAMQNISNSFKGGFDYRSLFTDFKTGTNEMQNTYNRAVEFMQNKTKEASVGFAGFKAHAKIDSIVSNSAMKDYWKVRDIYDNISNFGKMKIDFQNLEKPTLTGMRNVHEIYETVKRTDAVARDLIRQTADLKNLNLPSLPAPTNMLNKKDLFEKAEFAQFEKLYNTWDNFKNVGKIDFSKSFIDVETGANKMQNTVNRALETMQNKVRETSTSFAGLKAHMSMDNIGKAEATETMRQYRRMKDIYDSISQPVDWTKQFSIDLQSGTSQGYEALKRQQRTMNEMVRRTKVQTQRNFSANWVAPSNMIGKGVQLEAFNDYWKMKDVYSNLSDTMRMDFSKPFTDIRNGANQAVKPISTLHESVKSLSQRMRDISGQNFNTERMMVTGRRNADNERVRQALSGEVSASQQIKNYFDHINSKVDDTNAKIGKTAKQVENVGKKAVEARKRTNYLLHAVGTSLVLTAIFTIPQAFTQAILASRQLEAQMGSLDRMFGEGSNAMKEWAENSAMAFGLSTDQAVNGASQLGNVVRTFARDSKQMNDVTLALLQQVSVVASQTGRTIDDVTKRFISGMLGGTEAIENLGIFVRQSALKSTQAYKEIVGGTAWDDLSQAQQNQVYTMAILEQSYSRYGSKVNPAMLATMQFTAQLQNLRTNLGNAFVPILNVILPILNRFIAWLSTALAYLSAFFSVLFGTGVGGATKAVGGMADAGSDFADSTADSADNLDDASKSAKDIKRSLAGFDEINLITQTGGDETDSGAGGGAGDAGLSIPDFGQAGDYITNFQRKVEEAMDKVRKFIDIFAPLAIAIASVFGFVNFPITTAILILIGLFTDLWRNSDKFRESMISAWESIQEIWGVVWNVVLEPFLRGFGEGLMVVYESVKMVMEILGEFIADKLEWLADVLVENEEKLGWLKVVFENIGVVIGILAGMWILFATAMGIWTGITAIATGVTTAFTAVLGVLSAPVLLAIAIIGGIGAIVYVIARNWDWLSAKAGEIWNFICTWVSDQINGLMEAFFTFCADVKTAWDEFWQGVKNLVNTVFTVTMNFIQTQIDSMVALFKGIGGRIGDFFSGVHETFKRGVSVAWSWVSGKVTELVTWFKGIVGRIGDFFAPVFVPFKNGVMITWNWVSGKIDSLVGWFTGVGGRIGDFIGGVITTMKNSIEGAWGWVSTKIDDLVTWFKDIPSNIGDKVGGFFGGLFGRSFSIGINGQLNTDGLPANTPYLANGGLAFGKTTAVVGEYAGASANPEVIAPLDKLTDILVTAVSTAVGGGKGAGQDLYVNLEIDGTRFAKAVVKNVNDYTNATGRKVLKV